MARLVQGILGGIRGKIGNVVGSAWKGIPVIKAMPLSVANPQTAAQIAQRTKFSNIVAFAKVILAAVIKPLWDRFATKMSGYNAFISENIALFTAKYPSPYADFVLSKGVMEQTAIDTVTATNGSPNVVLDWTDDSGEGYKLASDEAYAVAYNVTQENMSFVAADAIRSDESTTIVMPTNCATGDTIYCWLSFRRADGTVVGDSKYGSKTV